MRSTACENASKLRGTPAVGSCRSAMVVAAAVILLILLLSFAVVFHEARRAPLGYEDAAGFHLNQSYAREDSVMATRDHPCSDLAGEGLVGLPLTDPSSPGSPQATGAC